MEEVWSPGKLTRLRTTLKTLRENKTADWREEDLILYLSQYKRNKMDTIMGRIRQLRLMARHPAIPVQLHASREDVVNSFCLYVDHREHVEKVHPAAVKNDHRAIRTLGDFLGIPREVWPTAPTLPRNNDKDIPSPEDVHALLHADYFPNAARSYENALVRYLLVFDFGIGVRFPSEAWAAKVQDLDVERGLITITEPKKTGKRRRLLVEPEWLATSQRHASLRQWLRWREKAHPTTDALFPRPDGTAFPSKYSLNQYLWKHVTPRFPWFHPYLGRHWSVNARLIDSDFDYARVAQSHGHESVNMTKNEYDHSARIHRALDGEQWLLRAFQRPPHRSKPQTGGIDAVSRVNESGSARI